jgi:hypothetical protein
MSELLFPQPEAKASMGDGFYVSPSKSNDDLTDGPRTHFNKSDAEAMCAALNAILGVKP